MISRSDLVRLAALGRQLDDLLHELAPRTIRPEETTMTDQCRNCGSLTPTPSAGTAWDYWFCSAQCSSDWQYRNIERPRQADVLEKRFGITEEEVQQQLAEFDR